MRNNVFFQKRNAQVDREDEVLKATSLLYLQDSLFKEQYELSAELVKKARQYGARDSEIKRIIMLHIRAVKFGQQSEVNKIRGGKKKPRRKVE